MKTITTIALVCLMALTVSAQVDSTSDLDIVTPKESASQNEINVEATDSVVDAITPENPSLNEMETVATDSIIDITVPSCGEKKDTVHIRVGKHAVEIISGNENTYIDIEKLDDFESKWNDDNVLGEEPEITIDHKRHKKYRKEFDGHWEGMDFGANQLWNPDYSMYAEGTPEFLTTLPEKSFEVNLNFAEYSFGFCSYVGIVTGLGLNFNDYKLKNRYTITKDDEGIIQPVELPEGDFRKSKISTLYLQAPVLLEIQIPGQYDHKRMFISGGVIGGLKLGEHTKYKIGDEKYKDKGDHNISSLRWGYTAKVGFDDVGLYATYYNTKFFEDGKGPSVTPLTVGFTFSFD